MAEVTLDGLRVCREVALLGSFTAAGGHSVVGAVRTAAEALSRTDQAR
jgi:hypothetical protein